MPDAAYKCDEQLHSRWNAWCSKWHLNRVVNAEVDSRTHMVAERGVHMVSVGGRKKLEAAV